MTGEPTDARPQEGHSRTRRILAVVGLSLVVAGVVAIPVAIRVADDDPAPEPAPAVSSSTSTTSSSSTSVPTQVLGTSETNPGTSTTDPGEGP